MSTVAIGSKAKALGICCVAIGDDVVARGAFQVITGTHLTLPDLFGVCECNAGNKCECEAKHIISIISILKDNILTYYALVDQGFAPKKFASDAENAINIVLHILDERLRKLVPILEPPTSLPPLPSPPETKQ